MIALDIETTGVNKPNHEMVSVGAVEIETGDEFYEECRLTEHEVRMASLKALEINGFTREELLDERKNRPYETLQNLMEWAEACTSEKTLVGINLPSFDVQFMEKYYSMIGYKGPDWQFGHRFVDLHSMAFTLSGKSMNHIDMCAYFGVKKEPKIHNALEGARMNVRLYNKMMSLVNDHAAGKYDPYIITNSGKELHINNLTPDMITLNDISNGLSMVPRFAGQGSYDYKVASHSINCSELVGLLGGSKTDQIIALFHDAAEAYLGDLASPIKAQLKDYQRLEKRLCQVIGEKFNIDITNLPAIVKGADEMLMCWEAVKLYPFIDLDWVEPVDEEMMNKLTFYTNVRPIDLKIEFQELYITLDESLRRS